MTKRAGKRKNRMGNQKHPPGKIKGPDTIEGPDNLKPTESLKLEIKALAEGWLVGEKYAEKRRKLVERLIDKGLSEDTPVDQMTRILRVVSSTDIQAIRTLLQAENAAKDTRPVVIVQQNNANKANPLDDFIDSMTPEESQQFLNQYGHKLANSAVILPANDSAASGEPVAAAGG